ncbi:unnamed protein product [Arctogadus glacialis]
MSKEAIVFDVRLRGDFEAPIDPDESLEVTCWLMQSSCGLNNLVVMASGAANHIHKDPPTLHSNPNLVTELTGRSWPGWSRRGCWELKDMDPSQHISYIAHISQVQLRIEDRRGIGYSGSPS